MSCINKIKLFNFLSTLNYTINNFYEIIYNMNIINKNNKNFTKIIISICYLILEKVCCNVDIKNKISIRYNSIINLKL